MEERVNEESAMMGVRSRPVRDKLESIRFELVEVTSIQVGRGKFASEDPGGSELQCTSEDPGGSEGENRDPEEDDTSDEPGGSEEGVMVPEANGVHEVVGTVEVVDVIGELSIFPIAPSSHVLHIPYCCTPTCCCVSLAFGVGACGAKG